MEHTKKLLSQYEAMMKLKNEEKLSRHQAWESELEVVPQEHGQVGGSQGGGCLNHALPRFPIQVLEILKLREEEEGAHTLTISIYDTKRNEKSKEYREAMVSLAPWLRPWLFLDTPLPQASRVVRMIKGSVRKPIIGEDITDVIMVSLAAELAISMMNTKEHAGSRPGLPYLRGLWPSRGLYCMGTEGKSCTHLHLGLPSRSGPGPVAPASGLWPQPEFSHTCGIGHPGYTLRLQGPAGVFKASF